MTARVLVVDDILANVKLLEARLSAEYFEVLSAFNGLEALELLETEHVDVVLLDVMMPGMDGFEVCRRIKQAARTMHLPVVMVTALDQPTDKVQGLMAGADDFITKPVDEVALITRVKNLARLKALNDEMLMRVSSGVDMGLLASPLGERGKAEAGARILLVEDQERAVQRVTAALRKNAYGRRGGRCADSLVASGRGNLRSSDRQPHACRRRWAQAVRSGALARAPAPPADHGHCRSRRRTAAAARAGYGRERLSHPPHRSPGAACARSHPAAAQALLRPVARQPLRQRGTGRHRSPHRACPTGAISRRTSTR